MKLDIFKRGEMVSELLKEASRSGWDIDLIDLQTFAEALWGEHDLCSSCGRIKSIKWRPTDECEHCTDWHYDQVAWKYHLQQMVISEDPILYLKEHGKTQENT